jgi:hypothetical protein
MAGGEEKTDANISASAIIRIMFIYICMQLVILLTDLKVLYFTIVLPGCRMEQLTYLLTIAWV